MIIRFTCNCGKPMQAKKEFAGRKMRCPACGTVLTIPSEDGGKADAASAVTRISKSNPEIESAPPPLPTTPARLTPPTQKKTEEIVVGQPAATKVLARDAEEMEAIAVATPSRPVKKNREATKKHTPANIWIDRSLEQRITPWPEGVKDRVGDITKHQSSGRGSLVLLLALVLLVGGAVAAFIFKDKLTQLF